MIARFFLFALPFIFTSLLHSQHLDLIDAQHFEVDRIISFPGPSGVYLGISHSDTLTFGGTNVEPLGDTDISIVLNTPNLSQEHILHMGGKGEDRFIHGALHNDRFYMIGSHTDTIHLPGSSATTTIVPKTGVDSRFLTAYDEQQGFAWVGQLFYSTQNFHGLVVDESAIYVAGTAKDSIQYVSPSGSVFERNDLIGDHAFLMKLNIDGEFQWMSFHAQPNTGFVKGLVKQRDDLLMLFNALAQSDLVRYDTTGTALATYRFQNGYMEEIAIDGDDNIYICGMYFAIGGPDWDFSNAEFFGPGDSDEAMLVKYDADMNFQWLAPITGSRIDRANGLAIGKDNDVFVTGCIQRDADFDPTDQDYVLNSVGPEDAFVASYDTDGRLNYAYHFGGIGGDIGFDIYATSERISIFGIFRESTDFDLGDGDFTITEDNAHRSFSYFLANYLSCLNPSCTSSTDDVSYDGSVLYPNPASRRLYIRGNAKLERLSIFDSTGKQTATWLEPDAQIDVSAFRSGIYLAALHFVDRVEWQRLVIGL